MAGLKNVEMIRQRVVRGVSNELVRVRSWISSLPEAEHARVVDLLRGEDGERLVADITELVMTHLGHVDAVTRMQDGANGRASQSRRAARGSI